MAEIATAPAPAAPATPAPSATPAPTPAATPTPTPSAASGGIDKAMAEFDQQVTPKAKQTAAKPGDKPADKPAAAAAKPSDEIDWEKADPKYKGAYFKHQRESQTKIESLEKKVKEIEGKAKEAPGDRKLVEEYQGTIDGLKKQLAQVSYERSDEFKTQYTDKWAGEYKAAVQEISQLQLSIPGRDGGEPTRRPATEADFQKILRLPPGDQDEAISTLFGSYSNRVFARMFELQRIERASQEAIANHAKTNETRTKESELRTQREDETRERVHAASMQELQQKWPEYFAPNDNDVEASEALQKGYDFVASVMKKGNDMPLEDKAAYSAVFQAQAAAFPRIILERTRDRAEIESLKAELKKYRASDPGSGDGGAGGPPAETSVGGIDDMVSKFKM